MWRVWLGVLDGVGGVFPKLEVDAGSRRGGRALNFEEAVTTMSAYDRRCSITLDAENTCWYGGRSSGYHDLSPNSTYIEPSATSTISKTA